MSDLRLSVSKTKTFLQCKKKYEYSYIYKMPKKEWDYYTFGKFCHSVLEDFHKMYLEGCLLPYNVCMGDAYKKAIQEYKEKMTPEMKTECRTLIAQYLKLVCDQRNNGMPLNVIAVEKKFEVPIENVILNGAIDRIQMDDDGIIHIADYKTSKSKKYQENDFMQLLTYAYVIATEDPSIKKIRTSYIMLRHDFEYLTKEFEIDEILSVREQFIEYGRQIKEEKEFKANPSFLCRYCDFTNICTEGKKFADSSTVYGEVTY